MSQPLVVTVILNTNRREDTLACLASLADSAYQPMRAIVLDNGSTDGSREAIRAAHPAVEVVALDVNLGYAGNNNVGIASALQRGADWVFLLNEDTVMHPRCVSELVREGEREARIGIVGPTVFHHAMPETIQSAGGMLGSDWSSRHAGQNEPDAGQFASPRDVDWVSGCAILVRRELILDVGMLDARFFYYWEETEWCLRATRADWRVVHVPAARLWHKGVQPDYRPGPNVTYYNTRNRLLMMSKHRAPAAAWLAVIGQHARTMSSWTLRPKWRAMRDHRDAMWQGWSDFLFRRWGQRR